MTKYLNKFKLIILSVLCALFSVFGVVAMNKPSKVSATASATTSVFKMDTGAYIRSTEPMGLRFVAKVDKTQGEAVIADANKTFGALIVPNDYLTGITSEWYTSLTSANKKFIYKEDLQLSKTVDNENLYHIAYSITNIQGANIDRDFFAIFYIKDTSGDTPAYSYATFEEGQNVKNIADIAEAALATNAFTGATETFLETCVEKGADNATAKALVTTIAGLPNVGDLDIYDGSAIAEAKATYDGLYDGAKAMVTNYADLTALETAYSENYVVASNMTANNSIAVRYDTPDKKLNGTVSTEKNADYGNVAIVDIVVEDASKYFQWTIDSKVAEETLADCTKVVFWVWYTQTSTNTGMWMQKYDGNSWVNVGSASIKENTWTEITMSVADYFALQAFGFNSDCGNNRLTQLKMTAVYGVKENTQAIVSAINALPVAGDLKSYHGGAIADIREAYNELSANAQALVSNYEAFTAIETAYNTKYLLGSNMTADSSLTVRGNTSSSFASGVVSTGKDATYGNIAQITDIGREAGKPIYFQFTDTTEPTGLEDCETVEFWIYYDADASTSIYFNYYVWKSGDGEINFDDANKIALTKGEWTKVTLSTEIYRRLLNNTDRWMGIGGSKGNDSNASGLITEIKMTSVYGVKTEA